MKKLLTQLPKAVLLLLVMLAFVQVNAQTKRYAPLTSSNFRYTIENDVQVTTKIMDFDLYVKNTYDSPDSIFECSSVQAGVYILKAISTGTITASYTASGLVPAMQGTCTYTSASPQGCIKLAAKAGPGCGLGTIITRDEPGTLLYHVRVTSTTDFVANSKPNLNFSFTTSPYKTAIWQYYHYSDGSCPNNIQIALTTDASNAYNGANFHNIILNATGTPTLYTVTGSGAYCAGAGTGMPVGLSGSQTGVEYTLYMNGIAQTPTYMGTGAALAFGVKPGALAPGNTYTVSAKFFGPMYTVQTPMTGSAVVLINPIPVITFGPLADACVGTAPIGLTATPSGGTYTGNSFLSGSTFNPSTLGSWPITYNVSVGGCAALPVTQYILVKTCGPVIPTWTGLVNTSWNLAGNWSPQVVPTGADDAIIPDGCPNYPLLMPLTTTYIRNLDVNGPSGKTLPMTVSGAFLVTGAGINGNLNITATGKVIVATGGSLTVDGNLSIVGALTIKNAASLITNSGVSGNATVERCVTGNLAWHFLSSPIEHQLILDGKFAPASLPFTTCAWDFYKWNPYCSVPDTGWRNLRNIAGNLNTFDFALTSEFEIARGYLVAYGDCFPVCKNFYGKPNTGDKACSFFDLYFNCWWLGGNPYPSAISWQQILTAPTNAGVLSSDYYYVWNELKTSGPGYEYWKDGGHLSSASVNGYIPSMQGFFIRGNQYGTKSLTIPNTSRVHNVLADYWLKDTPVNNNKLSIKLSNGTYGDEAIVMFENGSSVGKDRNDAEKLFGLVAEVPQVYTLVGNEKIALNSMAPVTNGVSIPVGIQVKNSGNYSLSVEGIENFASLTGLSLEDLKLGYTQNLMTNPVYNFATEVTEDAGRFLLHFAGTIGIGELSNSTINIYSNEKTVYITCAAGFRNAQVTISNLLGQEILTQKLSDVKKNQVNVNTLKGYYIVKVQDDSSVKTAKVYIN